MIPRKFVARTAREALAQVREALGPDAVILSNRKVSDGVEVTAVTESDLAVMDAATPVATRPSPPAPADEMTTVRFERFANERRRRAIEGRDSAPTPATVTDVPAGPAISRVFTPEPGRATASPAADAVPAAGRPAAVAGPRAPVAGPDERVPQAHADMDAVVAELRQMRSFISQQFSALSWVDGVRRTPAQARLLRRMLAACFSPRLARALVGSLPRECTGPDSDRWLADALERNLNVACFGDGLLDDGGVFALVGPTGVGKTTSAAKMAAHCALRHGAHRVGLIGIDTYRVAAQDQLRRYGDMIGIDVHTVRDSRALLDTVSRMADKHLVLIDTVGLGQRDPRVERLLDNLSLSAVRRLIVVSAAAQAEAIDETLAAYRAEQASGAVLTKVDEACRLGGALDALIRYRVPLVALGTGQRVPEDWQSPDAAALIAQALDVPEPAGERLSDLDLSLLMQRIELAPDATGPLETGALHV